MKLPDKIISSAYKEFGLSSNNPWEGTPFENIIRQEPSKKVR